MQRERQGIFVTSSLVGERYETYVPHPLPPMPAVNVAAVAAELETANLAIGELNGVAQSIVSVDVLHYMYIRREAVLSSQIEGTQSTLDDLLCYESGGAPGTPVDDVTEVSSYVAALGHGLKRIAGGFPLSLRLIREIHEILMTNARGSDKTPGVFRTSQNWLGGTRPSTARFVPPPPDKIAELLGQLEKFINTDGMGSGANNGAKNLPLLIKSALIHHQFETIHPFLDGNGRVGRLLITLHLCACGFLRSPLLYLSLFFKRHRSLYYENLNEVRGTGNWETWVAFFLEGVAETAADAKATLLAIRHLFAADEARVSSLGRARESAALALEQFRQKPLLGAAELAERTGLSVPTAISAVRRLMELGVIKNISAKKWGQIYSYDGYVKLLSPVGG